MAARGGPPDPTAEEKLPHPIIQSAPRLQKTIRHPGKAHLPTSIGPPPPPPPLRRHRCIEDPHTRAGPKRMHQPMLPAAHQPGPKPPRPSRNPNPEAEHPQNPEPPPDQSRNSAAARLASPAALHAVARKTAPKSHQYPIQAKAAAPAPNPSAEPPKKPTPREPPDAPGPQRHPTPTTKTTAGQNRDPHSH